METNHFDNIFDALSDNLPVSSRMIALAANDSVSDFQKRYFKIEAFVKEAGYVRVIHGLNVTYVKQTVMKVGGI